MKLKDFSSLGDIYSNIATNNEPIQSVQQRQQDILLTDAAQYVPAGKQVKAGSPLGGGPGTKGDVSPLAKKTGPEGLKGNDFEKVDKIQDPASDAKVMKKEEEGKNEEDTKENVNQKETAKITTPQEKIEENKVESNKYSYKPKFTMSKLKFDQLYEDAIKRIPFTEEVMANEADMADAGADDVAPADDAAADAGDDMGGAEGAEETTLSHAEAIEACEKLLAFLKKDMEHDVATGELGDEEDAMGAEGEETIAEEVEAEDEGHPLHNLKKGKPDNPKGSNTAGDVKKSGGTADKGSLTSAPEPKELGDKSGPLKGKNNKAGSGTVAKPGAKLFD